MFVFVIVLVFVVQWSILNVGCDCVSYCGDSVDDNFVGSDGKSVDCSDLFVPVVKCCCFVLVSCCEQLTVGPPCYLHHFPLRV